MKKLDMLVTGVGGQGIVLTSDIIAQAAITAGHDTKKTDTIGMSQRGGSVISHVRIGTEVHSPLIKQGDVDILLAFEKLEAARWGHYLHHGGIAIVNNLALPPLSVSMGEEHYLSDGEMLNILKQQADRIYLVDGSQRVKELGNVRTLNMFMLGCASSFIPFKISIWQDEISQHLPDKIRQINLTAFEQGRKEIKNAHI
ncbi:MAG: indolepyruvate oxidoreductase subunit beta [Chloroflexi bacterium]|nr:indolepyruvate oxidoreductase subunit beta [Chloroflexota bacterium]